MFIMDNTFTQSELKWYINNLVKRHWFFLGDNPDDQTIDETRSLGITKNVEPDFDELDYFLIDRLNKVLSYNFDPAKMRIIKNCFRFGDIPEWHTDSDYKQTPSFLFFMNHEWKWWWGSGLLIQEKFRKRKVRPKPGRLLVFDGSKRHKAIPPNLLYRGCGRFSVVIQYQESTPLLEKRGDKLVSLL